MKQMIDNFTPKMSEPFNGLNNAFGITDPQTEPYEPREYPIVDSSEAPITPKSKEDDFATVRETLHRILQKAENSLDDMANVARLSESARGYKVVSTLIGTVTDVATKIIELHDKKAKLDGAKADTSVGTIENQTNNNIVFTGSSADMLKMIQQGIKVHEPIKDITPEE